jgi:hypothetical protein
VVLLLSLGVKIALYNGRAMADPLREAAKAFILLGTVLLFTGVLLLFGTRLPFRLGRLPGDIVYNGRSNSFYFPIVTCLLVSILVSFMLWLASHFRR